ncbi:hypothetical protein HDV05_002027 [Chytridiales sp. JEL 0842]|nr:hypothetical protein HDV05_002027 [Chytridiales sp. JEL 0842]
MPPEGGGTKAASDGSKRRQIVRDPDEQTKDLLVLKVPVTQNAATAQAVKVDANGNKQEVDVPALPEKKVGGKKAADAKAGDKPGAKAAGDKPGAKAAAGEKAAAKPGSKAGAKPGSKAGAKPAADKAEDKPADNAESDAVKPEDTIGEDASKPDAPIEEKKTEEPPSASEKKLADKKAGGPAAKGAAATKKAGPKGKPGAADDAVPPISSVGVSLNAPAVKPQRATVKPADAKPGAKGRPKTANISDAAGGKSSLSLSVDEQATDSDAPSGTKPSSGIPLRSKNIEGGSGSSRSNSIDKLAPSRSSSIPRLSVKNGKEGVGRPSKLRESAIASDEGATASEAKSDAERSSEETPGGASLAEASLAEENSERGRTKSRGNSRQSAADKLSPLRGADAPAENNAEAKEESQAEPVGPKKAGAAGAKGKAGPAAAKNAKPGAKAGPKTKAGNVSSDSTPSVSATDTEAENPIGRGSRANLSKSRSLSRIAAKPSASAATAKGRRGSSVSVNPASRVRQKEDGVGGSTESLSKDEAGIVSAEESAAATSSETEKKGPAKKTAGTAGKPAPAKSAGAAKPGLKGGKAAPGKAATTKGAAAPETDSSGGSQSVAETEAAVTADEGQKAPAPAGSVTVKKKKLIPKEVPPKGASASAPGGTNKDSSEEASSASDKSDSEKPPLAPGKKAAAAKPGNAKSRAASHSAEPEAKKDASSSEGESASDSAKAPAAKKGASAAAEKKAPADKRSQSVPPKGKAPKDAKSAGKAKTDTEESSSEDKPAVAKGAKSAAGKKEPAGDGEAPSAKGAKSAGKGPAKAGAKDAAGAKKASKPGTAKGGASAKADKPAAEDKPDASKPAAEAPADAKKGAADKAASKPTTANKKAASTPNSRAPSKARERSATAQGLVTDAKLGSITEASTADLTAAASETSSSEAATDAKVDPKAAKALVSKDGKDAKKDAGKGAKGKDDASKGGPKTAPAKAGAKAAAPSKEAAAKGKKGGKGTVASSKLELAPASTDAPQAEKKPEESTAVPSPDAAPSTDAPASSSGPTYGQAGAIALGLGSNSDISGDASQESSSAPKPLDTITAAIAKLESSPPKPNFADITESTANLFAATGQPLSDTSGGKTHKVGDTPVTAPPLMAMQQQQQQQQQYGSRFGYGGSLTKLNEATDGCYAMGLASPMPKTAAGAGYEPNMNFRPYPTNDVQYRGSDQDYMRAARSRNPSLERYAELGYPSFRAPRNGMGGRPFDDLNDEDARIAYLRRLSRRSNSLDRARGDGGARFRGGRRFMSDSFNYNNGRVPIEFLREERERYERRKREAMEAARDGDGRSPSSSEYYDASGESAHGQRDDYAAQRRRGDNQDMDSRENLEMELPSQSRFKRTHDGMRGRPPLPIHRMPDSIQRGEAFNKYYDDDMPGPYGGYDDYNGYWEDEFDDFSGAWDDYGAYPDMMDRRYRGPTERDMYGPPYRQGGPMNNGDYPPQHMGSNVPPSDMPYPDDSRHYTMSVVPPNTAKPPTAIEITPQSHYQESMNAMPPSMESKPEDPAHSLNQADGAESFPAVPPAGTRVNVTGAPNKKKLVSSNSGYLNQFMERSGKKGGPTTSTGASTPAPGNAARGADNASNLVDAVTNAAAKVAGKNPKTPAGAKAKKAPIAKGYSGANKDISNAFSSVPQRKEKPSKAAESQLPRYSTDLQPSTTTNATRGPTRQRGLSTNPPLDDLNDTSMRYSDRVRMRANLAPGEEDERGRSQWTDAQEDPRYGAPPTRGRSMAREDGYGVSRSFPGRRGYSVDPAEMGGGGRNVSRMGMRRGEEFESSERLDRVVEDEEGLRRGGRRKGEMRSSVTNRPGKDGGSKKMSTKKASAADTSGAAAAVAPVLDHSAFYLNFPFPQFFQPQTTPNLGAAALDPSTGFETLYTPSQIPAQLRSTTNNAKTSSKSSKSVTPIPPALPTPQLALPAAYLPQPFPTFLATSSTLSAPSHLPANPALGAVSQSLVPARLRMTHVPVTTYKPAIVIEATGDPAGTYVDPALQQPQAFGMPGMPGMPGMMGGGFMMDPQQALMMAAAGMGMMPGMMPPGMMMMPSSSSAAAGGMTSPVPGGVSGSASMGKGGVRRGAGVNSGSATFSSRGGSSTGNSEAEDAKMRLRRRVAAANESRAATLGGLGRRGSNMGGARRF